MIDFTAIRNAIVSGLNDYISDGIVIEAGTVNKKPSYPYVSFTAISPYNEEFENPKAILFDDSNEKIIRIEDAEIVFSFSIHSNVYDEAHALALEVKRYFEFDNQLSPSGIAIKDTSAIQNRDVLLVEQRERRLGFDVTIRVESVIESNVSVIENVNWDLNISTE